MAIFLVGKVTVKVSVLQDSMSIVCDKKEKYPET